MIVKKMNDPNLEIGDVIEMEYPPRYFSCNPFFTTIDGEFTHIEKDKNPELMPSPAHLIEKL